MTLNRRNFLRTSLSGAALAVGSTALASCSSKSANTAKGEKGSDKPGKDLELKLSFQEGIAPGESLNEKLDFMEKLGVVGFEPGGGGLASRVNEILPLMVKSPPCLIRWRHGISFASNSTRWELSPPSMGLASSLNL